MEFSPIETVIIGLSIAGMFVSVFTVYAMWKLFPVEPETDKPGPDAAE